MKNKWKLGTVLLFGVFLLGSCAGSKRTGTITGRVQSIENGKDGYTAVVMTEEGEIYEALLSIPNMGMEGNYRKVEVGEKVQLRGEFWQSGSGKHLLVRFMEK